MGKLVLSRKLGESLMLGDDIQIKVTKIKASQVQLYITAPDSIVIWRREIWLQKHNQEESDDAFNR